MTPEQVILKGLFGWKFDDNGKFPMYPPFEGKPGLLPTTAYYSRNDQEKVNLELAIEELTDAYGSVEKAVKLAATYLQSVGKCYCPTGDGTWYMPFAMGGVDSDIELIAEAVKAGWKGEAVE